MSTAETAPPELPKSYSPGETEGTIRDRWDSSGLSHADPNGDGPPFCIVIPPPNVTAALHLGHAFNNTLQDILVRVHRMRGFRTLWMPGTDHAGIATQTVVEKRLLTQGKRRTDFEREEFVERVQAWKDEYEATITEQLQVIGCSCDWSRQRFTMDDVCAAAVREAFFTLFSDDLIYRGKRLVNWDPITLTALADDEVEMKEVAGHMWYLRYPLVHAPTNPSDIFDTSPVTWSELAARGYPVPSGEGYGDDDPAWVTVATTRPETYLGDTAVAVNPDDPRATALKGLYAQLPIVGRVIPVIHDDYVVLPVAFGGPSGDTKAEIASGFLKVTPAHDPNDWDIGTRHDLPVINVMAPDGSISDQHGWERAAHGEDGHIFVGMSREDARAKVVNEFQSRGYLEKTRDYAHSVGHSYRSHVPIEPYLSDQWYVRVSDDRLVGEASRAQVDGQYDGTKPGRTHGDARRQGDGELEFFPPRYAKMYQAWHDNLRDWCISRQLWWGHRIPVWAMAEGETLNTDADRIRDQLRTWADDNRLAIQVRAHAHDANDPLTWSICVRSHDDSEVIAYLERSGYAQDPDVLDTWFSSALWPISTMGWPAPDAFPSEIPEGDALLDTFNPSAVLSTGRDIITLWVSRMVMFNRYFRDGRLPFRHVYIHPMVQDGHGQRMSKSLGNGVDPRDIVLTHGADALRFALAQMATTTQDCRLPVDTLCPHCGATFTPQEVTSSAGYRVAAPHQSCPKCGKQMLTLYGLLTGADENDSAGNPLPAARNTSRKFDLGRNFANKLWNASRFALTRITTTDATTPPQSEWKNSMSLVDRWIISRLHRTLHDVEDATTAYQFNRYAEAMYDFIWREFCDWYLEAIKPTVGESPLQQHVLRTVLNATLRLMHPICPYVTETLWPAVQNAGPAGMDGIALPTSDILGQAAWPDIACRVDDDEAVTTFERIQALVEAIRALRGERNVKPGRPIRFAGPQPILDLIHEAGEIVPTLAQLSSVELIGDRPADAAAFMFEGHEVIVSDLMDQADVDAEKQRLQKEIDRLDKKVAQLQGRLNNEAYVAKAPEKMVQESRDQLAEAEQALTTARDALTAIDEH
ncbi:MAG: valine--tRNA ligase [Planctomycetota bacterium]